MKRSCYLCGFIKYCDRYHTFKPYSCLFVVNNDIINELNQDEKESQQVIDKLEKLVSEKVAADDTEASKTVLEKRKAEANLTLENKVRQTQLVTRQLKLFLKEYINEIGTQV